MIFIVAAEALVPTGAGPQPVELVLRARRSIVAAILALRVLFTILRGPARR